MTNQANQAFEDFYNENKHLYTDTSPYGIMLTTFQAATQASEIEINALKERVEELQASNNNLREAGQALVDRWNTPKWKDVEHTAKFIHALEKALSSTHAQSLAEHDNATIDRCKNIVADDALAITFQSMSAYRSEIIRQLGELKAIP